uniref:Uncharacterized protein n=1 Tax=Ananas comosus var. bracteatus TaxID=296719 RepID=A0A6V7NHP4_ANACO|nr:unnamed protein product [Ananas comosus var. bracteatus]
MMLLPRRTISPTDLPSRAAASLPLTFFDAAWLFTGPIERLFFYALPHSTSDFFAHLLRFPLSLAASAPPPLPTMSTSPSPSPAPTTPSPSPSPRAPTTSTGSPAPSPTTSRISTR